MKNQMKPKELPEWITQEEAMIITRLTSPNGFRAFAIRHKLHVNKKTGRKLYIKQEIYAALESGAVVMGV